MLRLPSNPCVLLLALVSSCAASSSAPRKPELHAAWQQYVHGYVQSDGRVVDQTLGAITTSEGQAYAMLRAVWVHDAKAFEELRTWTRNNLQGGDADALPAWKWGQRDDGTWGVIDANPASDADVLLAWALMGAAHVFDEPRYLVQARALADQIWATETLELPGGRVLLPGPWAAAMDPVWINPSYFAPSAFRAFALLDRDHDWLSLVHSSYRVLSASLQPSGLPPDWCFLDRATGQVVPPPAGEEGRSTFGFEAMRIPWMLAADERWSSEPRAHQLLVRMDLLAERFVRDGRIPAVIAPDGKALVEWESRALYGALLPDWAARHPDLLGKLRDRMDEIAVGPRPAAQQGREYYAANWVWFGESLWSGLAQPLVELP